jgi:nucleoside-diphosphate-sugar epimerase
LDTLKLFITGSEGFVGRNIVDSLSQKFSITAHTRNPSKMNRSRINNSFGDLESLNEIPLGLNESNVVIHAAAKIPNKLTHATQEDYLRSNTLVTSNLARKVLSDELKKFVFISTVNLYNKNSKEATEVSDTGIYYTEQEYFHSKEMAEIELMHIFQSCPEKLLILRIGTPYGNDEPSFRLIPSWFKAALNSEDLIISASPTLHLNYVHIADISHVLLRSIEEDLSGVFNLSAEGFCTLEMIAEKIIEVTSSNSKVVKSHPKLSFSNDTFPTISAQKLRSQLKFVPNELLANLLSYAKDLGDPN